jgi:hypothetical protein
MASSLTPEERARRRRAAELLGDLEPRVSRDETDEGWNEAGWDAAGTARDDELRRDVPPHHGG